MTKIAGESILGISYRSHGEAELIFKTLRLFHKSKLFNPLINYPRCDDSAPEAEKNVRWNCDDNTYIGTIVNRRKVSI